jgi:hypothetical protein
MSNPEAKKRQNYNPKAKQRRCGECEYVRKFAATDDYFGNSKYVCAKGGFVVKANGCCDEFQFREI